MFSIPKPWQGDRKHNELDKNRISLQNMGDSFYRILTMAEGPIVVRA
jgi:hypothetical protein